jgi:hypothetical protein
LEKSFRGRVPLLAFSIEHILQMERLLKALGLEARKLSKAAKGVPVTQGSVNLHQANMDSLRVKADFILRYVNPFQTQHRNALFT